MTTTGQTDIPGDPRTLLTVAALVAATPALIAKNKMLPEELQESTASLVAEMLLTYMPGIKEVLPLAEASTLLLRGNYFPDLEVQNLYLAAVRHVAEVILELATEILEKEKSND